MLFTNNMFNAFPSSGSFIIDTLEQDELMPPDDASEAQLKAHYEKLLKAQTSTH